MNIKTKRKLIAAIAVSVVGLPAYAAQTAGERSTPAGESSKTAPSTTGKTAAAQARYFARASKLIGSEVRNPQNEKLGKIEDLIVDTKGQTAHYAILSFGGIAGIGSATVFGTPLRYTACITENTERSPWETLAVSRGYRPDEDVITCAMVESPRLCYDDASQEPEPLLTGIADSMTAMGSWNMHVRSDMVVAMGPEHATICARAGMTRADVHRRLCELAGRTVRELRRGGNWRRERALKMNIDPDDAERFVPAIKDPRDLHLIVAGGWGPLTAVCHGWGGGSRAVHDRYQT